MDGWMGPGQPDRILGMQTGVWYVEMGHAKFISLFRLGASAS